ncbi:TrbL/VirB6 family protein [Rickettsia endosymbiont of Cardiosporidium cionae]|uniref:type IV secretion system protein n=1 Tax=Rickettsia endosymbiont of Cardiosporidium cionae TaxID=2777155 RepID=UPI001894EE43|nr:type IV secretion system protein [Rickettsia endosymbiont of Cardiosporidium cionae]KAF8818715.1 hypothetical protein IHI24_000440 [Rickettsia endosymbiont of Cardiosporidium cionae]
MSYFKLIILILFLLLESCYYEPCIDAEDFGQYKYIDVNAQYPTVLNDHMIYSSEYMPWYAPNGLVLNGAPLVITVNSYNKDDNNTEVSAWCSWYGSYMNADGSLSKFCKTLPKCNLITNSIALGGNIGLENKLCLFTDGLGLYGGLSPYEINSTNSNQFKIFYLYNLDNKKYNFFNYPNSRSSKLHKVSGIYYTKKEMKGFKQGSLLFKFFSNFYDTNSGKYRLIVKSGVGDTTASQDYNGVALLIKNFLLSSEDGVVHKLYNRIINNIQYTRLVTILITLYVIWTFLLYFIGNIDISNKDLVMRLIKIAALSLLVNTNESWDFFYNKLLIIFTEGVEWIISMVSSFNAGGISDSGVIGFIFSENVAIRLQALIFVNAAGIIYIIALYVAFILIVWIFMDAMYKYTISLIFMSITITMAPIFISCVLFSITRDLFMNWIKYLVMYALQPIVLFTGFYLISNLVVQEVYSSIGFRVCKFSLLPFIHYWYPLPYKSSDFVKETSDIVVPISHVKTSVTGDKIFCAPYECIDKRYPDLPFLDPKNPNDQYRIEQFHQGNFLHWNGIFKIYFSIFLLYLFVKSARFLANALSNVISSSDPERTISHNVRSSGIYKKFLKAKNNFKRGVIDKLRGRSRIMEGIPEPNSNKSVLQKPSTNNTNAKKARGGVELSKFPIDNNANAQKVRGDVESHEVPIDKDSKMINAVNQTTSVNYMDLPEFLGSSKINKGFNLEAGKRIVKTHRDKIEINIPKIFEDDKSKTIQNVSSTESIKVSTNKDLTKTEMMQDIGGDKSLSDTGIDRGGIGDKSLSDTSIDMGGIGGDKSSSDTSIDKNNIESREIPIDRDSKMINAVNQTTSVNYMDLPEFLGSNKINKGFNLEAGKRIVKAHRDKKIEINIPKIFKDYDQKVRSTIVKKNNEQNINNND